MNEKIARDPYLGPLAARWGDAVAFEAGFFVDEDPADAPLDDVGWLSTPTSLVHRAVVQGVSEGRGTWPVVLLSTGGFFPVHAGHLAMMERARRCAEAAGWWVVGGYLSPGHDDYIRLKCGDVPIGASGRLARAAAVVAGTEPAASWLSIDPWEALHRRVSVNFTDVTARLEAYLRAHVHPDLDVCFVCGADNARFALAFVDRGRCIVVGRPGSEATAERWRHDPRIAGHPRLLTTHGDVEAASSALRPVAAPDPKRALVLRLEDARAVATLGLDDRVWSQFQASLQAELSRHLVVEAVTLRDQGVGAPAPTRSISLDPMWPGEVDLGVSRLFDVGGYHQIGHVARPGTRPLPEQVAAIPPGEWTLRDDDRATGSTVAFVRAQLPADVVVTHTAFALAPPTEPAAATFGEERVGRSAASGHAAATFGEERVGRSAASGHVAATFGEERVGRSAASGHAAATFGEERVGRSAASGHVAATPGAEIADSRDFLVGADHGGLVIALPDGEIGRAPYVLPFVDPAVRSAVPAADVVSFSAAVWRLNAAVFAPTELTVADLPAPAAATFRSAGEPVTARLADVCERAATTLDQLAPPVARPAPRRG